MLTQHIWKLLHVWPGPFPDFLGWGLGPSLAFYNSVKLSTFYIIVNTNWRGRPGNKATPSPDTCNVSRSPLHTHHLGRVVRRGNWVGRVNHPKLSWSWRNPPIEEVLQNSFVFQWFHIHCGISRFWSVICLLGASWIVRECVLFDHFLWWGSTDMGCFPALFLKSLVRSSHDTTPVPAVQLEVYVLSQMFQQVLVGGRLLQKGKWWSQLTPQFSRMNVTLRPWRLFQGLPLIYAFSFPYTNCSLRTKKLD